MASHEDYPYDQEEQEESTQEKLDSNIRDQCGGQSYQDKGGAQHRRNGDHYAIIHQLTSFGFQTLRSDTSF